MILLTATRRNGDGTYVFKIEVDGADRLMTTDPRHVASTLAEIGVSHAEWFVSRAQEKGVVEIATE